MNYLNYEVKSGDTLYSIAKEFSTTVNTIVDDNVLIGTTIYPGQVLLIPIPNDFLVEYQIGKNETIESIAEKNNLSPYLIGQHNDFSKLILEEGQIIYLPKNSGEYDITSEDTVETIINKTKRNARHLMVLNQNEWLKPGKKIKI